MNKQERIELLCKMLGVELEEEFMFEGNSFRYIITREGITVNCLESVKAQTYINVNQLLDLKVIKLPWKPKKGELYYYINEFEKKGYDHDLFFDDKSILAVSRVPVYKTEEEVIAAVKEKGWVVE